jgi:hypothetical protein
MILAARAEPRATIILLTTFHAASSGGASRLYQTKAKKQKRIKAVNRERFEGRSS